MELYFNDIDLVALKERKVVIDQNKRDLLFCLDSNGKVLKYRQPQRRFELKLKETQKIKDQLSRKIWLQNLTHARPAPPWIPMASRSIARTLLQHGSEK